MVANIALMDSIKRLVPSKKNNYFDFNFNARFLSSSTVKMPFSGNFPSYWLKISEFHSAQCVVENLQNRVLWNGWIGFSYDNFIVIATAAFLESNDLRFG